eukprot:CAMPEP_0197455994 /NCGR_PEP_ID=MMETSP1175-20131217/42225_1 /TAXON_ID=1003142 /ORGANISM="Triceratium dubium, Strain CCMP147" /LENGTH=56 /DNA_ID=CAMNT_0042989997 /DNA_START=558 /DNA_END=728 /DNA_ORIENTATION=+
MPPQVFPLLSREHPPAVDRVAISGDHLMEAELRLPNTQAGMEVAHGTQGTSTRIVG